MMGKKIKFILKEFVHVLHIIIPLVKVACLMIPATSASHCRKSLAVSPKSKS